MEARKQLGGFSILDAAVFYKTQNTAALKQAPIKDIQLALLESLKDGKRSNYHRNGVDRHTIRFVEKFKDRSIAEIKFDEITKWLSELPGGGRNRDNHRNSVGNLFNFARIHGKPASPFTHGSRGNIRTQ